MGSTGPVKNAGKQQTVYVVEGYFDLLSMHQFGIENTVATLGTSLTADHVQILKGFVGEGGKADPGLRFGPGGN
jgi:DNA primase